MKYHRILLLTELGEDIHAAVAVIRRVAPAAELLVVIARTHPRQFARFADNAPEESDGGATGALDGLRDAAAGAARQVEVKLAPDLEAAHLSAAAAEADIDFVVAGSLPLTGISLLAELRKQKPVAVLLTASAPDTDRPIREVMCVAFGSSARTAVVGFLREHGEPALHATVLVREARFPGDLAATLGAAGIAARVNLVALGAPLRGRGPRADPRAAPPVHDEAGAPARHRRVGCRG